MVYPFLVRGYFAITDSAWFDHLSRAPSPRDANFWRPSARRLNLDLGTPFLFKLKAPHHAVAGFGFFAGFSVLPDWLAWDTFGDANGVEDLAALRRSIGRIKKGAGITTDTGGNIGCCLVAEARFFPREAWIRPPDDWAKPQQIGVSYDLEHGEGRRVWQECLALAPAVPKPDATTTILASPATARFGKPYMYQPRLGQGIFRVQVLDAYGRACAVTREHSLPVLEAAHIHPYAQGGEHTVTNGLALRSDVHRLFDKGYVTVDESHRFVVSARLKADFENGRVYYELQGRELELPIDPSRRPSPNALARHREQVFLR